MAADPAPTRSAGELIGAAWTDLMQIKRRLFLLQAFEKELTTRTGGLPFDIKNDAVWMVMLDSRDVLVIHLASWCKAAISRGGLFGTLRAHHLKALRARYKGSGDPFADRLSAPYRAAALDRLFPGRRAHELQPADVEALELRFSEQVASILDDRSNNRAHPWETTNKGNVAMVDFAGVAAAFELIESCLNDLGLILTDTTWGETVMLDADPERAAAQLVGMLLRSPEGR